MLRNYLLVAWRNLRKRVGPTVINVGGLAAGLAACLLIGLWVERELSYDDFHPAADRIYRVALDGMVQDRRVRKPVAPVRMAETLTRTVPEVEEATRFDVQRSVALTTGSTSLTENTVVQADSLFFDVFGGFELRHGTPATALDEPGRVVLSASTAARLFGRTDVVGESVELRGKTVRVTGVMADVPEASHFHFQVVQRVDFAGVDRSWANASWHTYAKLVPGASEGALQAALDDIVRTHVAPRLRTALGLDVGPTESEGAWYRHFAQPLTDIHLHSHMETELEANGSATTVYAFVAIGLFILLIACINFMNLITARAGERATEVGMRKALGAGRRQLMGQFFGETLLTTAAATGLALPIAAGVLPFFNDVAGTHFGPGAFLRPTVLVGLLGLVAVVGLLAGAYPAVVLSRLGPASALMAGEGHTAGRSAQRLRKGLVVVQFAISVAMIVGALVTWEQFDYIQSKRLGLQKERVVTIENADELHPRQAAFVDRLRRTEGVEAVAVGEELFANITSTTYAPADGPSGASRVFNRIEIGTGFVEAMGIDLVRGRSFDPARSADSMGVLINQAAADAFGWEDPVGRRLEGAGEARPVYTVIGVTDNFHYQSMKRRVEPLVLPLRDDSRLDHLYVRLTPDAPSETLDVLAAQWSDAAPQYPFQYRFLDRTYDQLHRDVRRAGTLFGLLAGLAVAIAGLGLFGLATYTVQRRRKEIGIRKALGATAPQVVGLLSRQFLTLVGIGALIALPLAYWGMEQWLQGFAYRTTVGAGVLAGGVVLAGAVAFLAIGYHALQAARLDPATTLRDE
jgi:putative ABC transport system permease protein